VPRDSFVDPASLDFRFRDGKRPEGFPEIPFARIGLYVDEYRRHAPDAADYRRAIRAKWDSRKSYDKAAEYDPKTVTQLLYFNTGKLLVSGDRSE